MKELTIAIDGPAGAGKSTVSQRLAQELGYSLLDTGALYRAVAWLADARGLGWTEEIEIAKLARNLDIRFVWEGDSNRVFVEERDVSGEIRGPEISEGASKVSSLPAVRAGLLQLQRDLGASGGVVAEGRDIGTVVFPDADLKFFLTASAEARARRRYDQLQAAGKENIDLADIAEQMRARDERDSSRDTAPLRPAQDAILVDSSDLTLEEVVNSMHRHIRTFHAQG